MQDINNGLRLYSYYGHSDSYTYGLGFDTVFFKANVNNLGKWPFFFSNSCQLGYYEDTPYNSDCFSEVIPKYSDVKGFIGSFAAVNMTMLDFSSILPIVPTSFYEIFFDNLFSRYSSLSGNLSLLTKTRYLSLANLPALDAERNKIFGFNLFCDPALNLFAKGFEITRNTTLSGDIIISNPIYLRSGYTLTLNQGTHVYFVNNGSLTIDPGATIAFNGSTGTITFHGTNTNNALIVNGLISNPNNIVFTANTGNNWNGLLVQNPTIDLTLNSTVSFRNCGLKGVWNTLNVNGVSFINSALSCYGGNLDIQNSTFTDSYIIANYPSKSTFLQIKNCNFVNNLEVETIRVDGYPIFNIEGNSITCSYSDAIAMFNCGSLLSRSHQVFSNTINYIGSNNGLSNGLKLYNSLAKIQMNSIMNCPIGISLLNLTNVELTGNLSAANSTQTQRICNNSLYQIYMSERAVPSQVSRNAIYRDDITTFPYIYFDFGNDEQVISLNVNNNYWGGAIHGQFIPTVHLQPFSNFVFNPALIWNLPYKSMQVDTISCSDFICEEYNKAMMYIEDSMFFQAVDVLKNCISIDTGSIYSVLSMKQLLTLANYTDVLPLEGLQEYFETNSVIQQTPVLEKTSKWLMNKCLTLNGNYQESINWLNSIVQNHELLADSVFAEIEIDYINQLINAGTKACQELDQINETKVADSILNVKRHELIKLLYAQKKKNVEPDTPISASQMPFRILNCFPNPMNALVNLEIDFEEPSKFEVKLFDIKGKECIIQKNLIAEKGINKYSISLNSMSNSLPSGNYFLLISTSNFRMLYPLVKL